MDAVIRGGTVVTPEGTRTTDVGIQDGRIVSLVPDVDPEGAKVVDARGCLVLPGVIDGHVHLELPAARAVSADSFETGTRAAACGGVTTVLDFAFFGAGRSPQERLRRRRASADGRVWVDYGLHLELAAVDVEQLKAIRRALASGQRSFKVYRAFDDPAVRVGNRELLRFAEVLAEDQGLLLVHAEDGDEVERRQKELSARGRLGPRYHALARPPEVEARAIEETLDVAARTGVEVYVVHVSSRLGLEKIREYKARGVRVYAETCPHYLLLTDEVYERPDGVQFLGNPPLKRPEDLEALWEGVRDGTLDTMATDHCPFRRAEKARFAGNFLEVPKGLPGIETLLPLVYTEGLVKRGIPLERLVELLSGNPARLFGLEARKGRIAVGWDADLVVFDPRLEMTIRAGALAMNTDFNPYEGWVVQGWPVHVFARGRRLFGDGRFLNQARAGRYVGGRQRERRAGDRRL